MSQVGIVLSQIEVIRKPRVERDLRIDVLRGLCILMMSLDHFEVLITASIGRLPFRWPFVTWASIGWSSAAEFFFFLSGYVFALVSLATLSSVGWTKVGVRAVHRAWHLYCINLVTLAFAALVLQAVFADPVRINVATGFDTAASRTGIEALVAFASLRNLPAYFDILRVYMLFLPAAALALPLLQSRPLGLLLLSSGLWLLAQLHPGWTLHDDSGAWSFDPLAWQLLFVCGMVSARLDLFRRLAAIPRGRRLLLGGSVLAIVFMGKSLLFGTHWGWLRPGFVVPLCDKALLQPLRLAHFAVSLVFLYSALPSPTFLRTSVFGRVAATVGRMSLEAFCCSNVLCYAAVAAVMVWCGASQAVFLALGLVIVLSLCGLAGVFEWWKLRR